MVCLLVVFAAIPAAAAPSVDTEQPYELLFSDSVEFQLLACDREGFSSFRYIATGVATGPYPGTFKETGTVIIGPQSANGPGGIVSGAIFSWYADFKVTSPNVFYVFGPKSLVARFSGWGRCVREPLGTLDWGADATLEYGAMIDVSGVPVTVRDVGISTAHMSGCRCLDGDAIVYYSNLAETYISKYGAAGCPWGVACLSH